MDIEAQQQSRLSVALQLVREGVYRRAIAELQDIRLAARDEGPVADIARFNVDLCRRRLQREVEATTIGPQRPVNVGVIGPKDPTKGLYRDVETLLWACAGDCNVNTSALLVDNLYRFNYDENANRRADLIRSGGQDQRKAGSSSIQDWLFDKDVIWLFEALNSSLLRVLKRCRKPKTILYVPNLEWAVLDPDSNDTESWKQAIKNSPIDLLCVARTPSIEKVLTSWGLPCVYLPWSIPDPIAYPSSFSTNSKYRVRILMNAGNLGYKDRRGLDVFLRALEQMPRQDWPVRVTIKTNTHVDELRTSELKHKNIDVVWINKFLQDREEIRQLYDSADVVVYPSRFEGFGLSLLEALHRGCHVIATDGDPMREVGGGMASTISAKHEGYVRCAPKFEPSHESLAQKLEEIIAKPPQRSIKRAKLLEENQRRFRTSIRSLSTLFG